MRHAQHSPAMRQVVHTLLLVKQRRGAVAARLPPGAHAALLCLPNEIWFEICGFLRSADFDPRADCTCNRNQPHPAPIQATVSKLLSFLWNTA